MSSEILSSEKGKLVFLIPASQHSAEEVSSILKQHPEIKFVSLVGVDLGGNDTDEKIPVELFIEDVESFLTYGVQTDGSSVVLPDIASLNDARVDIIPDSTVNWFVDYNFDNIDEVTGYPIGTLRIPSFLIHNDTARVDSRSVLAAAVDHFKSQVLTLVKENPYVLENIGISSADDIADIILTSATELEFWVKTPEEIADVEKLSTSQGLKEQYWKRTVGPVRTALENTLTLMDEYGLGVEMGHKEVGGVQAKVAGNGHYNHIMEQLEIDWKYSTTLQAADNELLARQLVQETFTGYGLEVTFNAKPIEGVAGSGEHTHVGVAAKLKNGKVKNLFSPANITADYMSPIGWGALMGLLKNYEVVNPFVSSTNDSLNRLKPGFEAPVCIVASVGHTVETPSRNRTILTGLVRDMANPLATRFEVRSPNPTCNTYLVLAAIYQTMLDGITAAIKAGKTAKELEADFSKGLGDEKFYLEKDRAYRSEDDVFEHFTEEERNAFFGKPPATVWENLVNFQNYPNKKSVLLQGGVFTEKIIHSYKLATLTQWATELTQRLIPDNMDFVRSCKKLHGSENVSDLDVVNWEKINQLRNDLMKDSLSKKSLFTQIREAVESGDYDTASKLQLEMNQTIGTLKNLYAVYRRNLIELA